MSKILNIINLGRKSYNETWDFQKKLHEQRIKNEIPDSLILVEHPHVYTLGKNAVASNMIASEEYLKDHGVEVVNVDRGGDITYHGPGQLVGYPIFHLKEHKLSVRNYVDKIEKILIQTLADYNIEGKQIDGLTGIWVEKQKIAAIGLRISRWVTYHGFALNIKTDLSLFNGIIPCGISDKGVTRMIDLNKNATLESVKKTIIEKICNVFGFTDINNIK